MPPNFHVHSFDNCLLLNVNYTSKLITVKNEICKLAKKFFSCFCRYQYPLSLAICTSLVIQVAATSSSMISDDSRVFPQSIDNLDTCLDVFCKYANMTSPNHYFFSTERCFERDTLGSLVFSSLEICRKHLQELYSSYVTIHWNTVCPSKHIRHNINRQIIHCFESLCSENNPIHFMDKNALDWCALKEINTLKRDIRNLLRNINLDKSDEWRVEDVLPVAIDLFFDMNKNIQALIASILSLERLDNLNSEMINNFYLLRQGAKKMFSSSITLIKDLLYQQSARTLPIDARISLIKFVEKMEEMLATLSN